MLGNLANYKNRFLTKPFCGMMGPLHFVSRLISHDCLSIKARPPANRIQTLFCARVTLTLIRWPWYT